jgi:hypothetical protein
MIDQVHKRQTAAPTLKAPMIDQVQNFFRQFRTHPASVGESYTEHLMFATRFALTLFMLGGAALVHALIPPLFEKTASNAIRQMARTFENRS